MDVRNKKVVFKDGFKLEYSKLLLAPGSRWEYLSRCPLLGTGQATGQDGRAQGARSPSLTLAVLQPEDPELQRQRGGECVHHPDT